MSLLSRLATMALAAVTAAGVLVATAVPAQAACATAGHVYVTQLNGQSRFAVRFETDPTGGPVTNFTGVPFRPDALLVMRLGGNGLLPDSFPTWSVVRSDGLVGMSATAGSQTSGNCVSNEKTLQASNMERGWTYFIRASYNGGTSGKRVDNQLVFSVAF